MTEKLLHAAGFYEIKNLRRISGGDINEAFAFFSKEQEYFVKINQLQDFPDLFEKEASGLQHLSENTTFRIPRVFSQGIFEEWQFLVMEFLPKGQANAKDWQFFAERLAAMHRVTREKFGFFEDNYLGTHPQGNSPKKSWAEFYSENRILPGIRQMYDTGIADKSLAKNAERLCSTLSEIYPKEPPSLIHGDLWGGNYLATENEITIIDPAVCYAHREMDIAVAKLFGGYPQIFYESYQELYPMESGLEERLPVSQLYHLIFHAVQFGGGYIRRVKEILTKF